MGRDRWASRTIFLFAAIGSAVGLGNVWRFPFLTYKFGGGAFLIPYLIALFVVGIPLLMAEFAIGQKMQKGAFGSFKAVNPKFRGVGFLAIISGFMVVVYYAAVMAWSNVYFIKSFSKILPWAENSSDFFYSNILNLSSGIGDIGGINIPLLLGLAATWIIIYFIVYKGTDSVGKVVMITMPLPIILLFILFIRGITLPGAGIGIASYLTPDFSVLLDSEIWITAVAQIFFTLSLAFGIMIAYSSYNKKQDDIIKNTYVTAFTNSAISLFAGFVVFAVLGYMATANGVAVDDVAASGPGLAFVVFPEAISLMPAAPLFAIIFFITLFTLGIDSAFSLVESANALLKDRFPKLTKEKISLYVCGTAFVLGLLFVTNAGLYFLDLIDYFVTNFTLILAGLFEAIVIGWVYGAENMRQFMNQVSDWTVGKWWNISIKYVIPISLIVLLVTQFIKEIQNPYGGYPTWAINIGWGVVVIPLAIVIAMYFKKTKDEN